MEDTTFKIYSDSLEHEVVETKSGKRYFVKGVFANSEQDLVNDILTHECLADMTEQMRNKTITVDVEHEAFRGDSEGETELNKTIIPVAKIDDFTFNGDEIQVKAELNQHSSRFKEVWGSLKGGFLKAFSFAFQPKTWTYQMKGNEKLRMLQKLNLLNGTFTGNPVNTTATIKQIFAKSLDFAKREGGNDMADEKKETETETKIDFSSELKSLKEEISGLKSEVKSLVETKDEEDEEDEDEEDEDEEDEDDYDDDNDGEWDEEDD